MKWFPRFVLYYLLTVCLLSWLRDYPALIGTVALVALGWWALRRGWLGRGFRAAVNLIKIMTAQRDNQRRDIEPFEVVLHTTNFIDEVQVRPLEFYAVLEQKILARTIPKIRFSRISMREAGPLSGQREYLHVRRKDLEFSICAAPFGTGFFVSQKLIRWTGFTLAQKFIAIIAYLVAAAVLVKLLGITAIAVFGAVAIFSVIYLAIYGGGTRFENDTAESFKRAVQNAIRETTNELTTVRAIPGSYHNPDRPLMSSLFQ